MMTDGLGLGLDHRDLAAMSNEFRVLRVVRSKWVLEDGCPLSTIFPVNDKRTKPYLLRI